MGTLHELMRQLTVGRESPDGSVAIMARGTPARIEVRLAGGCAQMHTEESLECQIDTVVRLAMMAYRQGAYRLWRQAAGLSEEK